MFISLESANSSTHTHISKMFALERYRIWRRVHWTHRPVNLCTDTWHSQPNALLDYYEAIRISKSFHRRISVAWLCVTLTMSRNQIATKQQQQNSLSFPQLRLNSKQCLRMFDSVRMGSIGFEHNKSTHKTNTNEKNPYKIPWICGPESWSKMADTCVAYARIYETISRVHDAHIAAILCIHADNL